MTDTKIHTALIRPTFERFDLKPIRPGQTFGWPNQWTFRTSKTGAYVMRTTHNRQRGLFLTWGLSYTVDPATKRKQIVI